eukprot:6156432-Amphidinium_carterae.1
MVWRCPAIILNDAIRETKEEPHAETRRLAVKTSIFEFASDLFSPKAVCARALSFTAPGLRMAASAASGMSSRSGAKPRVSLFTPHVNLKLSCLGHTASCQKGSSAKRPFHSEKREKNVKQQSTRKQLELHTAIARSTCCFLDGVALGPQNSTIDPVVCFAPSIAFRQSRVAMVAKREFRPKGVREKECARNKNLLKR